MDNWSDAYDWGDPKNGAYTDSVIDRADDARNEPKED